MHARQLVEFASLAALNTSTLVDRRKPLADDALSEYWIASRCRLDAWGRSLRLLGHSQTLAATPDTPSLLALAEEILLSEVFARVLAGVAHVHDLATGREDASPIGRNALDGCVDAHRRVRALTSAWWGGESPKRRLFKSLESRSAHWSDVLLAYVARCGDVDHLAIDTARLREFAYDSHPHNGAASEAVSELLRFAINAGFSAATESPVCCELNRRIGCAALGLFPPSAFDGVGLLRRPWMIRAERSAEEAFAMVETLVTGGDANPRLPLPARWRH